MTVLRALAGVAAEFAQQVKELIRGRTQRWRYRLSVWVDRIESAHDFRGDEKDDADDTR